MTLKVTNGPSKGHQIVLVERGSEKVAYASDLIPTPYHLPLPYIPATHEFPNETLGYETRIHRYGHRGRLASSLQPSPRAKRRLHQAKERRYAAAARRSIAGIRKRQARRQSNTILKQTGRATMRALPFFPQVHAYPISAICASASTTPSSRNPTSVAGVMQFTSGISLSALTRI